MHRFVPAVATGVLALASGVVRAEPTEPLALENPLTPWHNCSACHRFVNDGPHAGEPNVSPMLWQGSMMANAARDPVFWAGVALASQDAPEQTDDCIRCHAPRAFLEGRGGAIAIDELQPDDLGGVSCDLCHRMVDDGVTPAGNARYVLDDDAVMGFVPRRGPWTYAEGEPAPPHPWSHDAAFLASSRSCGTCHDVTTAQPRLDDRGEPTGGGFNEQRTYSEWLGSALAQPGDDFRSCQDCHMPQVVDVPGCEMHALNGDTHPLGRRHDLVGANRHMMGILRELYGAGGTMEVPDFHYDDSIAQVDELLATSATLTIEAPAQVDLGLGLAELSVTVENHTGHKLPTGYAEGRVMWLQVVARYQEETVWSSGQWQAGEGLVDDPQLRRYEAIAERYADGTQLHLLLNDHWLVDNRIPPRGLLPNVETDPVGDRYTLRPDGTWPNYDRANYGFGPAEVVDATPGEPDELVVDVRLLYVINTPQYVDVLVADNQTNDAGQRVADLFADYGAPEPMVVAEASVSVPLVGLVPPPAADSSGGPATDTSATVSGTTETSAAEDPPPTADGVSSSASTAATGDDSDGSGCACRAAHSGPGGGLGWLWPLVAFGYHRGRGRRARLRAAATGPSADGSRRLRPRQR